MNYRHSYHAGNHADVLKHVILARAIAHMVRKDKPLRIVDAHAGIGLYSLLSAQAGKTFEWRDGVGRLYDAEGAPVALGNSRAEEMLQPWRSMVEAVNPRGKPLEWYPGSPELSVLLTRPDDKLVFNELHPQDHETLSELYAGQQRVRVSNTEAMVAVKSTLPPPERRGLILIDPPYERRDDDRHAMSILWHGQKRFATGCFMVWYPVTGDGLSQRMAVIAREMNYPKFLHVEMQVRRASVNGGLAGSGVFILNPPWPLAEDLQLLLPALSRHLQQGEPAWRVDWINEG